MTTRFKILRFAPVFALVVACVDPINIKTPIPASVIILEGAINDEPAPYVVKISHAFALDKDTTQNNPVKGAKVVLLSDKGESESLVEVSPGVYHTGGAIRGTVGTTYHITVEMPDGKTFESEPEPLNPTGKIRAINYVFEHRTATKIWGVIAADVFNVFVDADAGVVENGLSYMRWRSSGTYKYVTNPELHESILQGFIYKTPFACSGYVVDGFRPGGLLRQDTVCTCCTCWVRQPETTPHLSDLELVVDGQLRNVKVAEVPITRATFTEKYYVAIEQMAISKNAFDFFRVIRTQKDGAANLFQPSPGRIVGNIRAVNADYEIVGLFWASSVVHGSIFISKDDLPYKLPLDLIKLPCTTAPNSTTTKPDFWE